LRAELEQVYRQHRQALFSLALTITGCAGLAEDSVHEAFVRLCGRPELPSGGLAAYVFAAVRNAAVDCCRRTKRERTLAETLFADAARVGGPVTDAVTRDRAELLRREIDLLDDGAREIIVMKIFGELTFDEIGSVLNAPAATVATRYRRALMTLEDRLRREL
jgi:RNA polymerase sigma-70 factor (ECF subfamily)